MAIVPIDFTNNRQTNEANFLLVIEIEDFDCEPEFPISLLDLYSPCLPSVESGIWLEQRGERVISDIFVNCYSEEDMANLLEDTKNNSKDSEKVKDSSSSGDKMSGKIEKLRFFSGNAGSEKVRGILHLFRESSQLNSKEPTDILHEESQKIPVSTTSLVCLLAIPVSISCTQIISFLAPVRHVLKKIWIVRSVALVSMVRIGGSSTIVLLYDGLLIVFVMASRFILQLHIYTYKDSHLKF